MVLPSQALPVFLCSIALFTMAGLGWQEDTENYSLISHLLLAVALPLLVINGVGMMASVFFHNCLEGFFISILSLIFSTVGFSFKIGDTDTEVAVPIITILVSVASPILLYMRGGSDGWLLQSEYEGPSDKNEGEFKG